MSIPPKALAHTSQGMGAYMSSTRKTVMVPKQTFPSVDSPVFLLNDSMLADVSVRSPPKNVHFYLKNTIQDQSIKYVFNAIM